MIYSNDDPMAILAMEEERTGNYGEDAHDESYEGECPECGAYNPDWFYFNMDNECIGCSECVYKQCTL